MPNSSIRAGQTVHYGADLIPWLQNCKYLFPLKEDSLTQSSSCEMMQNILIYLVQAMLYFKCFLILCGVNTSIPFTLFSLLEFQCPPQIQKPFISAPMVFSSCTIQLQPRYGFTNSKCRNVFSADSATEPSEMLMHIK